MSSLGKAYGELGLEGTSGRPEVKLVGDLLPSAHRQANEQSRAEGPRLSLAPASPPCGYGPGQRGPLECAPAPACQCARGGVQQTPQPSQGPLGVRGTACLPDMRPRMGGGLGAGCHPPSVDPHRVSSTPCSLPTTPGLPACCEAKSPNVQWLRWLWSGSSGSPVGVGNGPSGSLVSASALLLAPSKSGFSPWS